MAHPWSSTYLFGRGQWADLTGTTGNLRYGNPYDLPTPRFDPTDFNLSHAIKVNKNNEGQLVEFSVNMINLLNQRVVTTYSGGQNSIYYDNTPLQPNGTSFGLGAQVYQLLERGYSPQQWINGGTAK